MKQIFKTMLVVAIVAAAHLSMSSFITHKKTNSNTSVYQISLLTKNTVSGNTEWTWSVTNPNPGNGNYGTLQNISHWDVVLPSQAEDALVSAQYSYDGINWETSAIVIERD